MPSHIGNPSKQPFIRHFRRFFKVVKPFVDALCLPLLVLLTMVMHSRRRLLVWGPMPLISNKYWSEAMNRGGWNSRTLMSTYYSTINKREDYDLYYEDLLRMRWLALLSPVIGPHLAHLYIVKNARVVHIPFSGGPLGHTKLWRFEAWLYRLAGVRTVVLPYGADIYMYSKIADPTVRNGLLLSYPDAAKRERDVERRVHYWTRNADVIVMPFTMDGIGRWDIPCVNMVCIDTDAWKPDRAKMEHRSNRPVRILHAPNHRGIKGTEYILNAVDQLKAAGANVELVLLERIPNDQVRSLMQEVDILADQLILPGYGLNAIEGMASGLPVIANLEDTMAAGVFRRYSYLNECPIVSASPETVLDVLTALVANPQLRHELGRAGREYVEKYHSYATAQYFFGAIYRKFEGEDVDLMNLYHPLKSSYCRQRAIIDHPLILNKIPGSYFQHAGEPR